MKLNGVNLNPCAIPTRQYVEQITMTTNNQTIQATIFNQEQI